MKFLLVDDNEAILIMFAAFLRHLNHSSVSAENGEVALRLYCSFRPDVVITDVDMPVMNGIELLKKIKAINPTQKVAVLSGNNDAQKEVLNNGALFFLKPTTLDTILNSFQIS